MTTDSNGDVFELDEAGNVVLRMHVDGTIFRSMRLDNGRTAVFEH